MYMHIIRSVPKFNDKPATESSHNYLGKIQDFFLIRNIKKKKKNTILNYENTPFQIFSSTMNTIFRILYLCDIFLFR